MTSTQVLTTVAATPTTRLIALGASNLARGALALADVARGAAGGPVEILAALGRGRSYGVRSSLLGRTLPGIDDCGLWDALAATQRRLGTALLMDVGNDILYGFGPETIVRWVDDALRRLEPHTEHRIVAGLPLPSLGLLGRRRFWLVRTLLVPGCRLSLSKVVERAQEVELGLQQLARQHGAAFRPLSGGWYGFDPVHFRRRAQRAAFAALLGVDAAPPAVPCDGVLARSRLLLAAPAQRWWFGRAQSKTQPALRWPDGTSLAIY